MPLEVGGIYNASTPTFTDGEMEALQLDANGNLKVNVVTGGTGSSNVTVTSPIGQKTMAASVGVVIASDQSAIPITGSITATNPSVGTTGATAPASATELGYINGSGNLTAPTSSAGLPVNIGQVGASAITLGQKTSTNSLPVVVASDNNVNTVAAQGARTTGTITASAQTVSRAVAAYSIITLTVNGTYAGVTFATEYSDDSTDGTNGNWYAVLSSDSSSTTSAATTQTPGTNALKAYNITLPGCTYFRVRSTAYTSGTMNVGLTPTGDPMVFNVAAGIVGTPTVQGAKTNNGAAPGTNLFGAVVSQANAAQQTFTEGNNAMLSSNLKGSARMVLQDAALNDRGVNVTSGNAAQADITSVAGTGVVNGGLAGSLSVGGTVATNVAITDNPVNMGGQAVSSENSAVTTGRKVQAVFDLVGKQIVLPYANPENFVSGAITSAMTGTTSTSLIAAPASGLRNYVTNIVVSNSHATVGTDIIIQDGSGGTTLYTIPAAAVYGGATVSFPVALRQPTTATAIFCANVTTGSNTKVSATGYKGA